jgi:hypothetical protein
MEVDGRPPLLLDPSILVSRTGLSWLRGGAYDPHAYVVSARLRDLALDWRALAWFSSLRDARIMRERSAELASLIGGLPVFSYETVALSPDANAIRGSILDHPGLISEVIADEWTFLQSQSWFLARLRKTADRFVRAGASLVDHPVEVLERMLVEHVVPAEHIPATLTPANWAAVGAKWIGVGGASVAAHAFGPLIALGTEIAATKIVRMFDP